MDKIKQLSADDIRFLINLREESTTQDDDGQASPRFWTVGDTIRDWGYEIGYSDGCKLIGTDNGEEIGGTIDEIIEALLDRENLERSDFDGCLFLSSIVDRLAEREISGYEICRYKDRHIVREDTFFLSKKQCQEHIAKNHYHYNKPHTYAMTAWRSPQVEKLMQILEQTDWQSLLQEENK